MICSRISRRLLVQFVSSRSKSAFSSLSHSISSTSHRYIVRAAFFRPYSHQHFHYESQNNMLGKNNVWFMSFLATSTVAGLSFLGASSSSSQTLCESTGSGKAEPQANLDKSMELDPQTEPEIDPYDNLPEEDEPTHCSICLTYRQVGCSPVLIL